MSGTVAYSISKPLTFSPESCFCSHTKINGSNYYSNNLSFSRSGGNGNSNSNSNSFTVKAYAGGATAGGTAVMERRRTSSTSLYEILRIKPNATQTEIKSAYRSLAKVYHPDAVSESNDDGRDFIEIHNAYATLSDPSSRALYDLSLSVGCDSRSRPSSSPFSYASANSRSRGFATTRRWETDQCW